MLETLNEVTVEVVNDLSEATTEPKKRRRGKLRSKAWDHFTKLIREDGTVDKSQCNHCLKLFTCAGKIGTTHLLRHISEGACPVYNNEKNETSQTPLSSRKRKAKPRAAVGWKYDLPMEQPSQQTGLQDELLPLDFDYLDCEVTESYEDDYGGKSSMPRQAKIPPAPAFRSQPSWMNELRGSVGRLVELTNTRVPKFGIVKPCSADGSGSGSGSPPDYSLAAAIKCLNEMDDIPQSSEMYLDAVEVLKDEGERERFICLPPEPRRRWLQRILLRNYPLRYNHDSQ